MLESVALYSARRIDTLHVLHERCEHELREQEFSKLTTEAELQVLRAQINPHFLFNMLTTIGFLKEKEISGTDFLYLSDSFIRLFRSKTYPPSRGTLWHLEDRQAILYTKGSVRFYEPIQGFTFRNLCIWIVNMPKDQLRNCSRMLGVNQDELE